MDFVNKIVTVVLTFIMLVIAPITWEYVRSEMITERLVLNEMVQFLDRVTDKGTITAEDLDDLYLGVNSTGGTYDVEVKRYVRMSTSDEFGNPRTIYLSVPYEGETMNLGDIVKVTVDDVGRSPAKRLLWTLLRVDAGESRFSLSAMVR